MSDNGEQVQASGEQQVEFGKGREPGVAGPEAIYILRSVERWRMRGEGVVKS